MTYLILSLHQSVSESGIAHRREEASHNLLVFIYLQFSKGEVVQV